MTAESETAEGVERGVRARTRHAILDAAAAVWARDYSASLSTIAERAEVSRSTLHRYFTDRQALIDGLLLDSFAQFETIDAVLAPYATTMDGLEQFLRAGIDMGDRVIFLFSDPSRFDGNPNWDGDDGGDEMVAAIERARAEGGIAPEIPTAWAVNLFYAVLYTASEVSNEGVPRHVTADLAVRAFRRGVAP
ncbi:transcriptional regulator, TetR family [Beutenbergia cavernae DSM 12333]|uniref:Transcriptional regulator, TetR family n=1 Tax=Beutenbergia cavernae (strain ATCC BAA-8 / DSM 12333 / CCUG 43141 / JCM 11478 / NBRC 16432 / NCIMB 13614 / HKI 0122) TaxID=471853 RepID=C5C3M3_BEUC1|nr:TetR/AcrR family transcriptional regulator [Beutenbergia cavernae]ACQ81932.1 transcriptional regulator, TetR family [Beutenbergia cavernae DSM 12333]